jgi:serine/threonine protein kinase
MANGNHHADHDRAMQVLGDALDLAPPLRAAYLRDACGGDATLHAEVLQLLTAEQHAERVMATGKLVPTDHEAPEAKSIGPYRVLKRLGQGGMGRVYLVQQESPIRRTVALKLIRPGLDSDEVIARFRSERQALARMNHPSVARVFDAGTTEQDRPYFVMEYVEDGQPITTYCDDNRLSVKQRLHLFQQVCHAVHHAHQKGIIHRDLKPSNILVARDGESGVLPKVIDFGIAKAITDDEGDAGIGSRSTRQGQLIGTPEYMSPEQADTSVTADVDTRSDVYSLGVVLYELLAGVLPEKRDGDAPRPSAQYSLLADEPRGQIADRRSADAAALARALRGDLDWIVNKAIDHNRTRRYGSAGELAADLERHLTNEPVLAGPPTTSYRLAKFARRHRTGVAAGIAIILVLCGGIVTTSWQAVVARRAEARAQRRFNDVRKLTHTLLFDVHDQIANLNGATDVKDTLIQTSMKYLDDLSKEAAGDASLQTEMVIAYNKLARHLGHGGASRDVIASVLATHRKALAVLDRMGSAARPIDVAETNLWIAGALQTLGNLSEAIDTASTAMKSAEQAMAAAPNDMMAAQVVAGVAHLQGRLALQAGHRDQALTHLKRAESLMESRLDLQNIGDRDRRDMLSVLALVSTELVDVHQSAGDLNSATAAARRAVKIREQQSTADPDNRSKLRALFLARIPLARVLRHAGDAQAAVVEARAALALCKRLAQDDPRDAFVQSILPGTISLVAGCLADAKELDEAKRLYAETDMRYAALESAKLLDAFVQLNWAKSLCEQAQLLSEVDHNPRAALALQDRAVEKLRALLARDAKDARSRAELAIALAKRGDVVLSLSEDAQRVRSDRLAYAVRARNDFLEIQGMSGQLKKDALLPKPTEEHILGQCAQRVADAERRARELQDPEAQRQNGIFELR